MKLDLIDKYNVPPDFRQLALSMPALEPFLKTTSKGTSTLDFQDPAALRTLTAALLQRDFQLVISLPTNRLCPMVPGRFKYVHWILRLAAANRNVSLGSNMIGIDVGTGASAIYPLLATRVLSSLKMIGTEVDEISLRFARNNVALNSLQNRIEVVETIATGSFFTPEVLQAAKSFDFTMCNPPFYSNSEELLESFSSKAEDPFAVCTGSSSEMITPGGEVKFVLKMIQESSHFGEQIRWFSTLLGKFSSVGQVIESLKTYNINNFAVEQITSGQTKRWVVAWSFQKDRLPDSIGRSKFPSLASILPASTSYQYHCRQHLSLHYIQSSLLAALEEASIEVTSLSSEKYELKAYGHSWSRLARRKRARGEMDEEKTGLEMSEKKLLFCSVLKLSQQNADTVLLQLDFTQGLDSSIFSGFWAYIHSKIAALQIDEFM